jgi:hypothetical protein
VYKDSEAMTFHKTTSHYKAWADFKAANMDTVGKSQVCGAARSHLFLRAARISRHVRGAHGGWQTVIKGSGGGLPF